MRMRNTTPLSVMALQMVDGQGDGFHVVVAKGSFDIVPGLMVRLAEQQAPLRIREVPWENGKTSSVRFDDDLAPFKPTTDVIVNATASAPGGERAQSWRAGVHVGALHKRVTVTGPRAWVHTPILGWSLSPIVPVRSVPIRYELAHGGASYEANPVGLGHIDPKRVDKSVAIRAPQILTEDGRVPVFGQAYPVEGFSALGKAWQPRRSRAGTFDEAWAAQERPALPANFNMSYWNAAHPDLCADGFLRGHEDVALEALHPEHAVLRFRLPALLVAAGFTDRDGYRHGSPARLDTIFIDAEALRVELTWRATLPRYEHAVTQIHVAMRDLPQETRAA